MYLREKKEGLFVSKAVLRMATMSYHMLKVLYPELHTELSWWEGFDCSLLLLSNPLCCRLPQHTREKQLEFHALWGRKWLRDSHSFLGTVLTHEHTPVLW